MLLAIDIGNSKTKFGVFEENLLKNEFAIETKLISSSSSNSKKLEGFLKEFQEQISTIIISSVVPNALNSLTKHLRSIFKIDPTIVSYNMKLPITIGYMSPESLGQDRICNAVAGYTKEDTDIIIIDFGTATTFDVVNNEAVFLGGPIIPGLEAYRIILSEKTSQLLNVNYEKPSRIIGQSTEEALQSGLYYGYMGQINFIVSKIKDELKNSTPRIILTGGLAETIKDGCEFEFKIKKTLTLEGLQIISKYNSN